MFNSFLLCDVMFYVLFIYGTSHYVNHGHLNERGSLRDHTYGDRLTRLTEVLYRVLS